MSLWPTRSTLLSHSPARLGKIRYALLSMREGRAYKPFLQMALFGAETRRRRLLGPTAWRTGDVLVLSVCICSFQEHRH